MMHQDVEYILIGEEEIAATVSGLAEEINKYCAENGIDNLLVIGLLKGSVVFVSDLIRKLKVDISYDFMRISSYGNGSVAGDVRLLEDVGTPLSGRDVLVVEDIVDTGRTLTEVLRVFADRGAKSLKLCTLLNKPERRVVPLMPDFVGREIPDAFVVGYGLDFAEKYRDLPYIGVLKSALYE